MLPITSILAGHKVVGIRWVFKIKADSTYKGRLVVQRFSQITGIDSGGIFAPVCRLQNIRMRLEIAAELDYEMHMLGVRTAYLNANVEEDVLIKMMLDYEANDEAGVPLVVKLKKSSYGLR